MTDQTSRPTNSQTDDNSQAASSGGANVRVALVGYDRPFFTALALCMALLALILAWWADAKAERAAYFSQRTEAFIEQLSFEGYKVPEDLKGKRP